MHPSRTSLDRFLALCSGILLTLAVSACSSDDDDDDDGGGGSSSVDLLVSDAPSSDLLAFHGTVSEIRLVRAGGSTTGNLLSSPVPLEWTGLHHRSAWLVRGEVPPGTYTGMRIRFEPGSIRARRMNGAEVAVNATTDEFVADLDHDLEIGSLGHHRLTADLDVSTSLQGELDTPPLEFTPGGFTSDDDGFDAEEVQPVSGTVSSLDAVSGTLTIDAFSDGDGNVELGSVPVRLDAGALLVKDDGTSFASQQEFFDALVAGTTAVEVHGSLAQQELTATRIEIEDNTIGGGTANLVKMNGVVLGTGPGDTMQVAVANVGRGSDIVTTASGGELPETIDVSWDPSTTFFMGDDQTTTSSSLRIGQAVSVKFPSFSNPPFVASRVGIQSPNVGFNGTITDVSGMPNSFVVNLSPDSPAVMARQVASETTNVTVNAAGSTFGLDTDAQPTLTGSDLQVGMNVQAQGSISGTPTAPSVQSVNTVVFPGQLANATVVTAGAGGFTTTGGQLNNPFGGGTVEGPMTLSLHPGAVFHGAATSATEFDTMFNGLPSGQTMNVQVKGVGTSTSGTLVAHEVTSTTTTGP